MPFFAPILPYGVEHALRERSVFLNAVVHTPSQVIANAAQYKAMYKKGPKPQIVINGGIGDVAKRPSWDMQVKAAKSVGATAIMLPDVAHDNEKTVEEATKAIASVSGIEAIGVPQGQSYEDYIDCANRLVDLGVHGLGLSRDIEKVDRLRTTYAFAMRSLGVPVHMLGVSQDLDEDLYLLHTPGITSMSSAMPVWLGQKGFLLHNPWVHSTERYGSRPKDYFQSNTVTAEVIANIFIMSSWMESDPCVSFQMETSSKS